MGGRYLLILMFTVVGVLYLYAIGLSFYDAFIMTDEIKKQLGAAESFKSYLQFIPIWVHILIIPFGFISGVAICN